MHKDARYDTFFYMSFCSSCGLELSSEAKFCQSCGSPTNNPVKSSIKKNKSLVECEECGEYISKKATSCPSCGNQIGQSSRALKAAGLIILLPCFGIGILTGELTYPMIGLTVGGILCLLGFSLAK